MHRNEDLDNTFSDHLFSYPYGGTVYFCICIKTRRVTHSFQAARCMRRRTFTLIFLVILVLIIWHDTYHNTLWRQWGVRSFTSYFLKSLWVRPWMSLDVDLVLVLHLPCSGPFLGPAASWPLFNFADTFHPFYSIASAHDTKPFMPEFRTSHCQHCMRRMHSTFTCTLHCAT